MSYSVFIKYGGRKYKLPVNPEEITKTEKLNIEKYQVLGAGQVSIPTYKELTEYSFECELPHLRTHYMESGARADPDYYIRMLRKAQQNLEKVQLIYSNGETDDESASVFVESVEITEKAGEEGDKYLSLSFLQNRQPQKRYMAVVTTEATVKQPEEPQPVNPAVESGNEPYTVIVKDSLWKIAQQFYSDGSKWPKIYDANRGIIGGNPNLIYPGQVLTIPA